MVGETELDRQDEGSGLLQGVAQYLDHTKVLGVLGETALCVFENHGPLHAANFSSFAHGRINDLPVSSDSRRRPLKYAWGLSHCGHPTLLAPTRLFRYLLWRKFRVSRSSVPGGAKHLEILIEAILSEHQRLW